MIEILATGPANTVQDAGRYGLRAMGVSTSGTMDPLARTAANLLLGNDEGAAVLEIQSFPLRLRFTDDCAFALTGAAAPMHLAGLPLPSNSRATGHAGSELVIDRPKLGARCYLALPGGIDVPQVLGSAATHARNGFGGYQGRDIAPGDKLHCQQARSTQAGIAPAFEPVSRLDLRVVPGADLHLFPKDRQDAFWNTNWQITPQSNRSGYRLRGAELTLPEPVSLLSYGLVPGIVQVPPSGEPIIQMADANTAGGYPRIAGVIEADLWKLAQARIGAQLHFVPVDFSTAAEALAEVDVYLEQVRRAARMVAE